MVKPFHHEQHPNFQGLFRHIVAHGSISNWREPKFDRDLCPLRSRFRIFMAASAFMHKPVIIVPRDIGAVEIANRKYVPIVGVVWPVRQVLVLRTLYNVDIKSTLLRIIESFVSSQIAHVSGNWVHATTSADNAILVKKDELEMYIEEKRRYYLDVKEALLGAGVDFEVFEYDRDLRAPPQQVGTMKRLLGLMFDSSDDVTISPKEIFKHVHIEKQAIVPLHEQVKNWNDVVEWGYGGESEEWEGLFHEEIPYCWDKKPSV